MAWHPRKEGLLVTGAVEPDNLLRVWSLEHTKQHHDAESSLMHTLKCNHGITSLSWHDFGNCSELVSSHIETSNKLSLWQVDDTPTAVTPYRLTKVRDFYRERLEGVVLTQAVSPCGTSIATLSSNEQISVWKLFE